MGDGFSSFAEHFASFDPIPDWSMDSDSYFQDKFFKSFSGQCRSFLPFLRGNPIFKNVHFF